LGKKQYLVDELGLGTVELMMTIKRAIDPLGLFNPGKVFDFSYGLASWMKLTVRFDSYTLIQEWRKRITNNKWASKFWSWRGVHPLFTTDKLLDWYFEAAYCILLVITTATETKPKKDVYITSENSGNKIK